MKLRFCCFLFCKLFFWSATLAQELELDPSILHGQLENGLHYFIKVNQKPENRAELRLVVDAGSLQEEDNQLGIAHFVEHMAFNGTKHYAKNELVNYLELSGTRFGADLNAYTSFDETVYQLQVRTDSSELLDQGMLILRDWAGDISFEAEEIDKERGVVISEWRSRLSPDQRLQQQYYPIQYQDSRYAERLPIGDPEIIQNVSPQTIKAFYNDWYRPNLMAVVAVGDFDPEKMEAEIKRLFQDLKNPSTEKERVRYQLPFHDGKRSVVATDEEAPFTRIQLQIKQARTPNNTVEGFQQRLRHLIYNRMLGARLYELQQLENPPFTFASSAFSSSLGNTDVYYLSAFVGTEQAKNGFGAVYKETLRAKKFGFTSSELERQKKEILTSAQTAFKERENVKSNRFASNLVYHFLQNSPVLSPEKTLELYEQFLPKISLEEINELPRKWLSKDNQTLTITGPSKDSSRLPSPQDIFLLMDSLEKSALTPYIDRISDKPLFNKNLSLPAPPEAKYYEDFDVSELKLSNGVSVILKPTTFKEDEILMQAFSPGGHSLTSDEDYQSAIAATTIASLSGLSSFSSPELQKSLAGIKVNVGPYITEQFEGLGGSASPDDLEKFFQLIYLHFTSPRFEEKALQGYKQRQTNVLQNIGINPYYYFGQIQASIKYQDHPRRKGIPSLEDLNSIDLNKAQSFYEDRFADASDFTFIFVGSFDLNQMKTLVNKYLGNLPSINRQESFKDVGARLTKGVIDSTVIKGKAPKAIVDITFHGDFDYNSRNRYDFLSMLAVLRIELRERLREELGGVYGVNVNGFNSQRPEGFYRIGIRFNAEPETVDTLIQTTYKVIKSLSNKGPKSIDVAKVKETQLQSRLKAEKENSYWMSQLNYRYQEGMPLSGAATNKFQERVNTLSEADVKAAAKRYFNFSNFIQLVLLPEE